MLNKFMFSFIAVFLISILTATNASAQTFRAIVINDAPGGCGALGIDEDAEGLPLPPYVLVPSETGKHITATVKGGKLILTCKVKDVPNTTGRAVTDMIDRIYADYGLMLPCSTRFYDQQLFTFDTRFTLSASGVATTTCIFDLEE
jgi:hypothetical protein